MSLRVVRIGGRRRPEEGGGWVRVLDVMGVGRRRRDAEGGWGSGDEGVQVDEFVRVVFLQVGADDADGSCCDRLLWGIDHVFRMAQLK